MFDILDEYEAADQSTEAMTGFRKLPIDDNEDNNVAVEMAVRAEGQVQLDSPDELIVDESESWSDDPVRMYLTQMGEIPLLTRRQEIELAKRIEETRRRFRTKLAREPFCSGRSLQDPQEGLSRSACPSIVRFRFPSPIVWRKNRSSGVCHTTYEPCKPFCVAIVTIGRWRSVRARPNVVAWKLGVHWLAVAVAQFG